MHRSALLLIIITALSIPVAAQNNPAGDTVLYSKILLIPYSPFMHLSDADDDWSQSSEKSKEAMRAQFRDGLVQNIDATLLTTYKTYLLATDVNGEELTDLETIYGSLNYVIDTVYPVKYPQKNATKKDTVSFAKKLFGKKPPAADVKYMNVTLSHPELLSMYSKKYGTDLFVFLNQVEIVTHAKDCYDMALKSARREIRVHYSAYDVRGRQVYGDVAIANATNNSADFSEIVRTCFPAIGQYVQRSIPPKEVLAIDGQ